MLIPRTEILVLIGGTIRSRHEVEPGEYTIGRDPYCAIHVPANLVSAQHARLIVNYQEWLIEDLGSTNGTLVNGVSVNRHAQRVWPSQKITVGKATIELRALASTDPLGSLAPTTEVIRQYLPPEVLRDRRYEIVRLVNDDGGMGLILEATDQPTARTVAMKVMRDQTDGNDVVRFIEEAKVTAQLEHPNIVPVHELGVNEQDQVFYTMKFVRGVTLRAVLDGLAAGDPNCVKKYPLVALLTIFQKICDALAFAHSRGVVHRDLKPANLMLGDFGEVLVMDWGLAKVRGTTDAREDRLAPPEPGVEGRDATLPGAILGTLKYMSPEQARGEAWTVDGRADIYALGAILSHLLVLRPPVTGSTQRELLEKVSSGELDALAPAPGQALPHLPGGRVPGSLAAVARRALALNPKDRYQTVASLQADLARYQAGFATDAEKAGAWKQLTLLVQRNRVLASAVAASLFLLAVISAVFTARVIAESNEKTAALVQTKGETARANQALGELEEAKATVDDAFRKEKETGRKMALALAEATTERLAKQEALERRRKSAPVFYVAGLGLAYREQRFDDALAMLEAAVDLEPENPQYLLSLAHLYQATEKLEKAAAAYEKASRLPAQRAIQNAALENLALCREILQSQPNGQPLAVSNRGKLVAALLKQDRPLDAAFLGAALKDYRISQRPVIESRLSSLLRYFNSERWADRLRDLPNGSFRLDLSNLRLTLEQVPDLTGLPITELNLDNTDVRSLSALKGTRLEKLSGNHTEIADLSPLAGLPLKDLSLRSTSVTDLAPLASLPLERLVVSATSVADLSPLRNLPLVELVLDSAPVTDLDPIRKLPLKRLSILYCRGLHDLSPIHACKGLETLLLPPQPNADLLGIRSLPNLERLSDRDGVPDAAGVVRFDTIPSAAVFWATRRFTAAELTRLEKAWAALLPHGAFASKPPLTQVTPKGLIELDVQQYREVDLNALRGLPIVLLKAHGVRIADFSPLTETPIEELRIGGKFANDPAALDYPGLRKPTTLRHLTIRDAEFADLRLLDGLQLESLDVVGTSVRELSPLLAMPLSYLDLTATKVVSILPLLKLLSLKQLGLPDAVYDVDLLKQRPELVVWRKDAPAPPKSTKPRRPSK